MSSGRRCLIRDLGLVKGAKGSGHHKLVIELSWRGVARFAGNKVGSAPHRTNGKRQSKPPRLRDGAGSMAD